MAGTEHFATDGNFGTIQTLINSGSVVTGDAIRIPNGTWNWNGGGVIVNKAICLRGDPTNRNNVTITSSQTPPTTHYITLNKSTAGPVELAYITVLFPFSTFAQTNGNYPIYVNGDATNKPALIHDCYLRATGWYDIRLTGNGGVIWNCQMDTNGFASGGYGVNAQGFDFILGNGNGGNDWRTIDTMGMDDSAANSYWGTAGSRNSYIEDCQFLDMPTGMCNVDDCARVVIRNCNFNNTGIASHGQETSPQGIRQMEIYDNIFIGPTLTGTSSTGQSYPLNFDCWIDYRGGTGVVTRNGTAAQPWNYLGGTGWVWGAKHQIQLNCYGITRPNSYYPCPPCANGQVPSPPTGGCTSQGGTKTTYPAPRQVGQGWNGTGPYGYTATDPWPVDPTITAIGYPPDGSGYYTSPLYIWNNVGTVTAPPGGFGDYANANIQGDEGCNQSQSAANYIQVNRDWFFSAKPNWTSFTYPHPFRQLVFGSAVQPPIEVVITGHQGSTGTAGARRIFLPLKPVRF